MRKLLILPFTLIICSCFSSHYPEIEEVYLTDTIYVTKIDTIIETDTIYKKDTIIVPYGHSGGKTY